MFTTGETVGLAEWIIDDTCLVFTNTRKILMLSNREFYFHEYLWTFIYFKKV